MAVPHGVRVAVLQSLDVFNGAGHGLESGGTIGAHNGRRFGCYLAFKIAAPELFKVDRIRQSVTIISAHSFVRSNTTPAAWMIHFTPYGLAGDDVLVTVTEVAVGFLIMVPRINIVFAFGGEVCHGVVAWFAPVLYGQPAILASWPLNI